MMNMPRGRRVTSSALTQARTTSELGWPFGIQRRGKHLPRDLWLDIEGTDLSGTHEADSCVLRQDGGDSGVRATGQVGMDRADWLAVEHQCSISGSSGDSKPRW